MTTELNAQDLARSIQDRFPGSVVEAGGNALVVSTDTLAEVARHCYEDPDLAFDFLVGVTGVDYIDHFEVVYHLLSIKHNHSVVLKTRAFNQGVTVRAFGDRHLARRPAPGAGSLRPDGHRIRRTSRSETYNAVGGLPGPSSPQGLYQRIAAIFLLAVTVPTTMNESRTR